MFLKKILIIGMFFSMNISLADEASVNNQWCNYMNGISEYRTSYGTYVDCLTDNYAIETEVDYNWKEAIGQALHYAEATEKKPAILFIKSAQSNVNYLYQLQLTIEKFDLPIKIFVTESQL